MAAQMTGHVVGAATYERSEGRTGHRNGPPQRLQVQQHTQDEGRHAEPAGPQGARRHLLHPPVLPLSTKREGASFGLEMYVEGVSTKKVAEVTELLCGTSFSKSLLLRLHGG